MRIPRELHSTVKELQIGINCDSGHEFQEGRDRSYLQNISFSNIDRSYLQ